jgi:hypothetical protein
MIMLFLHVLSKRNKQIKHLGEITNNNVCQDCNRFLKNPTFF